MHNVPHPHAEFGGTRGELHTLLRLAQLFLRYFALGDVAGYPARARRFAMFVELDATITRDPARASVRLCDAIFAFTVDAILFEHMLHTLLHTFAIFRVHDLKQLASVHWLRFRKAEQPSPFVRDPKFVIPEVPNPQTEVCGVGREVNARFALPQCLLSPPAFRHGGGKRHCSNGKHSRPGLQSKKRLVFRFPDEWPETMQCAPNRER